MHTWPDDSWTSCNETENLDWKIERKEKKGRRDANKEAEFQQGGQKDAWMDTEGMIMKIKNIKVLHTTG